MRCEVQAFSATRGVVEESPVKSNRPANAPAMFEKFDRFSDRICTPARYPEFVIRPGNGMPARLFGVATSGPVALRERLDKPFITLDAQLALLESRGLIIDDGAREHLAREGYYQVINGYKDPFLISDDLFEPGTKYSHIASVFEFDR